MWDSLQGQDGTVQLLEGLVWHAAGVPWSARSTRKSPLADICSLFYSNLAISDLPSTLQKGQQSDSRVLRRHAGGRAQLALVASMPYTTNEVDAANGKIHLCLIVTSSDIAALWESSRLGKVASCQVSNDCPR